MKKGENTAEEKIHNKNTPNISGYGTDIQNYVAVEGCLLKGADGQLATAGPGEMK